MQSLVLNASNLHAHGLLIYIMLCGVVAMAFASLTNLLSQINTIAAIRHAAVKGHTVLMSQTDDIHDSFYDLFNQHFRCIDDPDPNKEPRFYTNVAIGSHSKPCRVHKDFQCVVIVSKSEPRSSTPPPFLNRFEKYSISHKDFLDARLRSLPPCLCVAVQCALEKVCSDCSTVIFTVKRNCSGYMVSTMSAGKAINLGQY